MDRSLAAEIERVAALLRRGGVVAYPTETFYGLGALARDAAALDRLARAKGRPEGKPLPLIAADAAMVEEVAVLGATARRLAAAFWPGPLTLVLGARPGLPDPITGGTGTVGIRVPGSEVARALCRAAGGPIVSTSANPAGGPPPASGGALDAALRARIDGLLDAGPTPGGRPSTVVRVDGERLVLLREGAIAFDAVERASRLAPVGDVS
ncbi:MAG TPA: L-threonylcarbamoyladenylate synthase [Anaeromyxobacteraceae bacterium]|nr:L-threonylcarbamoyladenylate synthase [Anaeromyxobacteraceae bacterium]